MYRTLILNKMYRPHETLDWKEAVTRMFGGKIEVLAQYDEVLTVLGRNHLKTFPELQIALRQVVGTDMDSITIHVPAVAVLRRNVKAIKTGVRFSKHNVATRDDFTCQYCAERLPLSKLSKEHVIPQSRGGKTDWDNIVMACYECNTKKANRTPEQAGMPLLSVPRKPKELPLVGPVIDAANAPVEWLPYLSVA